MLKSLKKLLNKLPLRNLFGNIPAKDPRDPGKPQYGDKVGDVTITSYAQLVKHTEYKPGEQYRLGEGIVTVHADKSSMYMALLRVETTQFLKHAALTKRAEDMMMMSPEELQQFKVTEWLAKNKQKAGLFQLIIGRWWNKDRNNYFNKLEAKYARPVERPKAEASKTTEKVKVKA